MTHIPPEYQTDHLFLLVGANPLPNLVAARLLARPGGAVCLVHSAATAQIAQRLETVIAGLQHVGCFDKIEVREADAQDIETKVGRAVRAVGGSVGLHYTGGTKPMSVHAFRAVDRESTGRRSSPVFSYLDAGSFELRIAPRWREKVLLDVHLALDDVLALHGITLMRNSPQAKSLLPDLAGVIASSAPGGGMRAWRDWCGLVLRDEAHDGEGWLSKSVLFGVNLPMPGGPLLADTTVALKYTLGLPAEAEWLPLDPSKCAKWPFPKRKPGHLCQWLDGDWLEDFVLSQVQEVAERCQLHDCVMRLKTDPTASPAEFEFDVVALRGYQFFGISCGTGYVKGVEKLKLFEAYVRARQLGGDEARVGLVCGYEDPARLEQEMATEWDATGKVRVFGPDHLPALGQHLAHWFTQAS